MADFKVKAAVLAAMLCCAGALCSAQQKKMTAQVRNVLENHFVEMSDRKTDIAPFQIMDTEVPQWLWTFVTGTNPSKPQKNRGQNRPVIGVPFYDALVFCNRLSMMAGRTPCYTLNGSTNPDEWGSPDSSWQSVSCDFAADGFRLPTVEEWRFAADGGYLHCGYQYSGNNTVTVVAWSMNNSGGRVHDVATTKASNEQGLYDMSGNASEWCWDPGDADGVVQRPILGGSFQNDAFEGEEAHRFEVQGAPTMTADLISNVAEDVGIRLVCTIITEVEDDSAYNLVLEEGESTKLGKGTWLSTNPAVVSVKKNTASAEGAGVATLSSDKGERITVKVTE